MLFGRKTTMIDPAKALKGGGERIPVAAAHAVLGTPLDGPYPDGLEVAYVAEGCFWGAEQSFWQTPGVWSTSVGYQGGYTANPTYEQVCSARTGHAEVVRVVFDPVKISYPRLLKVFWEGHDPTQGMRQGMDLGTQYRSAIYATSEDQLAEALASRDSFQQQLRSAGYGSITTEIIPAEEFYPAEDYHQQYLAKVPGGYCGHGGTGVSCPVGVAKTEE